MSVNTPINIPVIDVYEFKIKDINFEDFNSGVYPRQSGYKQFDNTPKNKCGLIEAEMLDESIDMQTNEPHGNRSCDVITNVGVDSNNVIKLLQDAAPEMNLLNEIYKINPSEPYCEYFEAKQLKQYITYIIMTIQKITATINCPLLDIPFGNIFYDDALIYTIKCDSNAKIINMGDIHGSFHSMFRNVRRLMSVGIMNENFKLAPNYYIILTGDLIGYGMYSIWVLFLASLLMLYNKNNVFYIRGNHEGQIELAERRGANDKITAYFVQRPTSIYDVELEHLDKITKEQQVDVSSLLFHDGQNENNLAFCLYELFKTLPSAIIIDYGDNKRIWYAHGGVATDTFKHVAINIPKLYDDIKAINTASIVSIHHIMDPAITTTIRFADFSDSDAQIEIRKGQIIINEDSLYHFMMTNKIEFIVRGHFDRYHASFIHTPRFSEMINPPVEYIKNISMTEEVTGPIIRIICDKDRWSYHYPVLTLTTAVGPIKKVSYDSMAILRADIPSDKIIDFSNSDITTKNQSKEEFQFGGSVLTENRISMMLRRNIVFEKYMKYKLKYNALQQRLK